MSSAATYPQRVAISPTTGWKSGVPLARIETHDEVMAMSDRLLRRRQVEEVTGLSRSSIYRHMQSGDFPRPVRVGPNAVRWRESDVTAWLESRPIAGSEPDPPNRA